MFFADWIYRYDRFIHVSLQASFFLKYRPASKLLIIKWGEPMLHFFCEFRPKTLINESSYHRLRKDLLTLFEFLLLRLSGWSPASGPYRTFSSRGVKFENLIIYFQVNDSLKVFGSLFCVETFTVSCNEYEFWLSSISNRHSQSNSSGWLVLKFL